MLRYHTYYSLGFFNFNKNIFSSIKYNAKKFKFSNTLYVFCFK